MDPAVRFTEIVNGPAADRNLDLLCALMASVVDHSTDVGSIILGLDRLAEVCSPSFDGVVDGLFASGLLTGDSDDYHDPRNSFLPHGVPLGPGEGRVRYAWGEGA